MTGLTAAAYADFVRAVHGRPPFPWQQALVEQVLARGAWPDAVDAPTGLGKTSVLDAAVFVAAAGGPARRRRVFFVVDRRIVVDEAREHADRLATALRGARDGVLLRVADGLRELAAGVDDPVQVTTMRGGVTWSADWLDRPDRFGIVLGTVDQVGSRLLFRGYSVSALRAPIDAALVGSDSLIAVDEAHLAQPLLTTVADAFALDGDGPLVPRPHLMTLSATTRPRDGWTLEFDVDAHLAHEVATRRLRAAKSLSFTPAPKGKADAVLAGEAARLLGVDRAVLVVCNTVDRARAVHSALAKKLTCVELLTGRSRGVDREVVVDRIRDRMGVATADRADGPMVLVATQTIEVGANIDADALVTECPSVDALVQRLGRVNRLGDRGSGEVVVVRDEAADDPVYGAAASATWAFLSGLAAGGPVEAGPLAVRSWHPPGEAYSAVKDAPLLLAPILDSWARTSPRPEPDTPVEPYLRGLDADQAGVSLTWRDDLDDLLAELDQDDRLDQRLRALPPAAGEQLELRYGVFRRWLAGEVKKLPPLADTAAPGRDADLPATDKVVCVVRDGAWVFRRGSEVRPGDAVVVPASYGGLDRYGWAPASQDPVPDVAERARVRGAAVRLDARTAERFGLDAEAAGRLTAAMAAVREAVEDGTVLRSIPVGPVIEALAASALPWAGPVLAALDRPLLQLAADARLLLVAESGWRREADDAAEDGTSIAREPMTLARHGAEVGARARTYADSLGLPERVARTVELAAAWHDLGKSEPRFQAVLHGDPFRALIAEEPLAKSGALGVDWRADRQARRAAGLPRGARHEAWSAQAVSTLLAAQPVEDVDEELLVHLVAAHHGHGRPLLPPVWDERPTTFEVRDGDRAVKVTGEQSMVDWSGPVRFRRLNQRYGRWGLALLETVVRHADMRCSEEG